MRNFKKLLSLVLCMAVMLSVMVVGAGAAFSDQKEIKNTEAVDACATLNIINGYTDGSFKPEGTITRAEACKMICVALNGGKEPALGTNVSASFTDTKGHWAEGYIESCVTQGIVAGIGGGKFNPNGNVTGSQFAKMLLIALGYKADMEGFTGSAWEVNVNVKATQKDLYNELASMDPSAALTRDNAAQMVWNALQADEVEYQYTLATENGQLVSKVTVQNKANNTNKDNGDGLMSLLEDKYGATVRTGIIISVGHTSKGYTATLATKGGFAAVVADQLPMTKLSADPTDMVGKAVKAIYKASDEVYGIYVDPEYTMTVVESTISKIDTASVAAGKTKVKVDGTEYSVSTTDTTTLPVYTTLGGQLTNDRTLNALVNTNADSTTTGSKIVFIDNTGDEKLDLAVVTPVTVAKVNYRSSDSFTLTAPESTNNNTGFLPIVKDSDSVVTGDPKKGDYVSFVNKAYNACGDYEITKLNVVTGTVKGVKSDAVMIDSTWYDTDHVTATFKVGNKVSLVVLNGVAYAVPTTEAVAVTDYLVLTSDAHNEYGDIKAKAVKADGTEEVITISKVWDDAQKKYVTVPTENTLTPNVLYSYKIVDGKYQVTKVAALTNDTAVKTELGYDGKGVGKYADKKIDSNPIDSNALVFVTDKDGTKVMTGSAVVAWKDSVTASNQSSNTDYIYDSQNGYKYVKVAYINISGIENPGATSDTLYGYVVSDPYASELSNGESAMALDLFDGASTAPVLDKANTTGLKKGDIVEYTKAEDGVIKVKSILFSVDKDSDGGKKYDDAVSVAAAPNTNVNAYISALEILNADKNYKDSILQFNGDVNKEFKITDDTVILYINAKDTAGVTGGAIQRANYTSAGGWNNDFNALYVSKTTNNGTADQYDLKLLVVDVNNDLDA